MRVQNVTRNHTLVNNGRLADNRWTRLKGLIGVKDLPQGDGLVIKPCKGVHCMFMSIPIDVVYVDKNDCVIGVDHGMKPWRVGRMYAKGRYVVELPAGTIAHTETEVGDQLTVEY